MFAGTSEIVDFFKNQTVFITGGSGFLGKILIEKLLRKCDELEKIYVLLRPKKNKTSEERFEELFQFACFENIKSTNPEVLKKVFLINGDCQEPLLGLSEQDLNILTEETTCVIHAAANVKFDQSLQEATYNVRATRDLLQLAKKITKLRVFVYVSTAYANCLHSHIKEEFYEPPLQAENLFSIVTTLNDSDDSLKIATKKLLKDCPNTYILSKCISESVIQSASEDLPITMIRPAIVASTAKEPMPGWIDNFYGVVGIVAGAALGVIRTLHVKKDAYASIVPADYVSNCILAAAWKRESASATTIYNYVGHKDHQLTWMQFMEGIEPHCWAAASEKVVWYFCFKLRENRIWHNICIFFLHIVPAYLADGILICLGRPTKAVKAYERIHKMLNLISYFSTRSWTFEHDNVTELWNDMNSVDRKLFFFNMENMDWDRWGHYSCMGARRFLLKDTPDTLDKGRRKIKMLFVAHYTVLAILCYLLYKFIMFILGMFV